LNQAQSPQSTVQWELAGTDKRKAQLQDVSHGLPTT